MGADNRKSTQLAGGDKFMKFDMAEKIANAVLYEGYMLYPYRPSSIKNRQHWNFGTLYPPQFDEVRRGTERSHLHVECLLETDAGVNLKVHLRFLQFPELSAGNWEGAVERSVEFPMRVSESGSDEAFSLPSAAGEIKGAVRLRAETVRASLVKLYIDLLNESALDPDARREVALAKSLNSAHMILQAEAGGFVSLLDPPERLQDAVAGCKNTGCFPVLVGDEGEHNMLLCSPIILYDYPQIAPESNGDFFDSTEMDEMLTLRVTTLTEEEKNEVRSTDDRTRSLLERTERTAREQLMRTHGAIRSLRRVNE
jgi:hypothetical protein